MGVMQSMAKNITKSATITDGDAGGPEIVATEDGLREAGAVMEAVIVGADSLKAAPSGRKAGQAAVRLHETHGSNTAGQLAAQGAMRTAYYCVFGTAMNSADLVAWAEGGIDLSVDKRDAEILARILKTLGILAEVGEPA